MDDEWWPEDEEDGTPLPPPGAPRPAPATPDYRPQPVFDPLSAHNETYVRPDYGGTGPDPHIGITASGQETGAIANTATQPARMLPRQRAPGQPRSADDYPAGALPGRPAIAPPNGPSAPDIADPRTPSRIVADSREELARETTRREDGTWEQPTPQIYAPTPVEGRTAVAGVPVALPPRTVGPARPVRPDTTGQPGEAERPPMDQVQPGQQVSAEWRYEREMPVDLPQAPESAWAQPPTAPLPIIKPRSAPPAAYTPPKPRAPIEPLHGVPHQVPPAPMPRANPPGVPTAEEFARRRAEAPAEPQAEMGVQAALRRSTFGLISPAPGRREQEFNQDVEAIQRTFGGLRQITVVNPKSGAGKTTAVLMLAMAFGQRRGGSVLAWDTDDAQRTLGRRAQPGSHAPTVRDLLRDLPLLQGPRSQASDLAQYVRAQGEAMFDVLAADASADHPPFGEIRDVVSRFYKIVVVDTGNDPRTPSWRDAVDATDQLVVTMAPRNDCAEMAVHMLDYLEQAGRTRAVRQAVTVLSMPQSPREFDVPSVEQYFAARTRAVIRVPHDRVIDRAEPIDYHQLSDATRAAWIKIAAMVADGL